MRHSQKGFQPRYYPGNGDVTPAQIDRVQTIDPTLTMNREKVEELGRDGVVTYVKKVPALGCRMTQLEYGSMAFWNLLANQTGQTALDQDDFKSSYGDITAYTSDDDGTFKETIWYPKVRLNGFSVTIGSPEGRAERSFDFVGEDAQMLQGTNKYLIYLRKAVVSGEAGELAIIIGSGAYSTYPVPVVDPNNAGKYILKVVRVRSSVTTDLTITTDYTYVDGTKTLTFLDADFGDVFKVYYSASSYISGSTVWTDNDSDIGVIMGESASLYVGTTNYLYKIQSATIDVRFEREDFREIGNKEIVLRGIKNITSKVTLGKILDARTIEEVMAGKAADWGIITPDIFSSNLTFISALYADSTKAALKIGYKCTEMTPSSLRPGTANINAYVESGDELEGENFTVTSSQATLGI